MTYIMVTMRRRDAEIKIVSKSGDVEIISRGRMKGARIKGGRDEGGRDEGGTDEGALKR